MMNYSAPSLASGPPGQQGLKPQPVPTAKPGEPTAPLTVLPNWDAAEVEKKLKENAEALLEWAALMDKADLTAARNEDVPAAEVQQHIALKRKLHENLGIMAKMVQQQIKKRGPLEGTAPVGGVVAKPVGAPVPV